MSPVMFLKQVGWFFLTSSNGIRLLLSVASDSNCCMSPNDGGLSQAKDGQP